MGDDPEQPEATPGSREKVVIRSSDDLQLTVHIHKLDRIDKVNQCLMSDTCSVARRISLSGPAPIFPKGDYITYQMGPLLPPKVISTMITFKGKVTRFVSTHQYRNCSFVVAHPTRTSDFAGSSFEGPSTVIELSDVGLSPKRVGQRGSRDSTLGTCAA